MNDQTLFAVVDRLESVFGVDVSEARKLTGQALQKWVDEADELLFQSLLAEPSFSFEVFPRSEALGGGWTLKLYLGKEEMAGGVFEPGDDGYSAAYAEGFAWQYQRI